MKKLYNFNVVRYQIERFSKAFQLFHRRTFSLIFRRKSRFSCNLSPGTLFFRPIWPLCFLLPVLCLLLTQVSFMLCYPNNPLFLGIVDVCVLTYFMLTIHEVFNIWCFYTFAPISIFTLTIHILPHNLKPS